MAKTNKQLLGLTLIELIMTISVVVILAGVSLASMSKLRRPKDLVDEATSIIVNTLNQANATAISTGTPQSVCNLTAGTSSRATCTIPPPTTWTGPNGNVNGSTFNSKVEVRVSSPNYTTFFPLIIYCPNGVLFPISPGPAPYICPTTAAPSTNSPFPSTAAAFVITVTTPGLIDSACGNTPLNTINLWPNGVVDVVKNCNG